MTPNLYLATPERQAKLERWARFLGAKTAEELEQLAHEDPLMETAKNVLQELSADPVAQRLAREREAAVLMHRHMLASSFEAGLEEGIVKLRDAVQTICRILEIPIDDVRANRLEGLDLAGLARLVERLETERRWPEDL